MSTQTDIKNASCGDRGSSVYGDKCTLCYQVKGPAKKSFCRRYFFFFFAARRGNCNPTLSFLPPLFLCFSCFMSTLFMVCSFEFLESFSFEYKLLYPSTNLTFQFCLIVTQKRIIKKLNLYDKLKNKLRYILRLTLIFQCFY